MALCRAVLPGFILVVASLGLSPVRAADTIASFLRKHCSECHNANTREAGLRLDTLGGNFADRAAFDTWVKVHDKLRAGLMPPPGHLQPQAEERARVVAWLDEQLRAADRARRADLGRAFVRRLNRTEYEYSVRDLLAMDGLRVKEFLPEDGRAYGYNKSSEALDLSYVQLSKYLEAADEVLQAATAPHADGDVYFRHHFHPADQGGLTDGLFNGEAVLLKDFKYDDSIVPLVREAGHKSVRQQYSRRTETSTSSIGVFRHDDDAFHARLSKFKPAYAGRYRLRISLWSFLWDKGEVKALPQSEAGALVTALQTIGYFEAPPLKPKIHEVEVWFHPGEEIVFNAASLLPVRVSQREGRAAEYVGPGIAIDWFEIEGPVGDQWPPESHRRLFGDAPLAPYDPKTSPLRPPHRAPLGSSGSRILPLIAKQRLLLTPTPAEPLAEARRLLAAFLERAFRRPASEEELLGYVCLVEQRLDDRYTFEAAMSAAYKAVLCSPEFLYLVERPGVLDHLALASRLSYFLWNSLPDDELRAAAQQGTLHEPEVLRAQVERMLGDPRCQRFVNDFTDQWLDLENIDLTTPDKRLYPEFSPYLRHSMLAESRAFFAHLLANDLSVLNVVDSDFAMLNQRLAELYGIEGVTGADIRRVDLPEGCYRGGFLTQAAILKVTANGTTTSPVTRGAWVLREILGQPPEPPPPDIPAIDPDVRGTTTVRALLAKHRSDPTCASCHRHIDPPGFALECFDVVGGWRQRYRSLEAGDPAEVLLRGRPVSYKWGSPVDATGAMSDGRAYANINEFKQILLSDPDQICRNLAQQLLVYATGAEVGYADRQDVEEIVRGVKAKGYGLRTLVHEVVQSRLFREK